MSSKLNVVDLIWPTYKSFTKAELEAQKDAISNDFLAISEASWGNSPNLYLEELHRMYDEEQDRRKAADTKASNYLLVAAALISILTYLGGLLGENVFNSKITMWIGFSATTAIILGILYILGFVWWSFKALEASAYTTTGTNDLLGFTKNKPSQAKIELIESIAKSIRSNQDQTNSKITFVNLSHMFLFRIFIMFSIIAVLQCLLSLAIRNDKSQPSDNIAQPAAYNLIRMISNNGEFQDPFTKAKISLKSSTLNSAPIGTIELGIPLKPVIQPISEGDTWSYMFGTNIYELSIRWIDYQKQVVDIQVQQKIGNQDCL